MTESTVFETRLAAALGRYADLAPVHVDEVEILAAVAAGPTPGWRWHLPVLGNGLMPRLLLVGLLLAALVAAALIGTGALRSEPEPTGTAIGFAVPFEYSLPLDTPLRRMHRSSHAIVGWSVGTEAPSDIPTGPDGRGIPASGETHGVFIGLGEGVWGHGPSSRYELDHLPVEFIANLRDISRVPMTETIGASLDGRPAAMVTLTNSSGVDGTDIHLPASEPGSTIGYLKLSTPGRLIVAEIDGTTVYVLIWARSVDALEAWMPDAERFVESITFLPQ